MELRQARYFVAVAQQLSFTRAARALNISQPPLSLQIKKLEQEIGARLLTRDGRRILLTPAGAAFLPRAQRIIAEVETAIRQACDAANGVTGDLHLGFVASASHSFVPAIARALHRNHPRAQLRLSDLTNRQQVELLTKGELDMGIVRTPADTTGFATVMLCREPFRAIVAADHELARRKTVHLRDIARYGLIVAPRLIAPTLFDAIMRSFNEAGLSPRIDHELNSLQIILDIAAAGLGVTIQPLSVGRIRAQGLSFLPIADMREMSELRLAYDTRSANPLVHSMARSAARRLAPAANAGQRQNVRIGP